MKKTGNFYLLDTNITIDFFTNDDKIKEKVSKTKVVIPSIVIGELYYDAHLSSESTR